MPPKEKPAIIKVESYSGYRADERPVSFIYNDRRFIVETIIKQWRSPDSDYFKIETDNGTGCLLAHNYIKDVWVLEKIIER